MYVGGGRRGRPGGFGEAAAALEFGRRTNPAGDAWAMDTGTFTVPFPPFFLRIAWSRGGT